MITNNNKKGYLDINCNSSYNDTCTLHLFHMLFRGFLVITLSIT